MKFKSLMRNLSSPGVAGRSDPDREIIDGDGFPRRIPE
jgi:hypothetical protein